MKQYTMNAFDGFADKVAKAAVLPTSSQSIASPSQLHSSDIRQALRPLMALFSALGRQGLPK